jgi:transcriptional regulator with PAS, ATPase and Fis domain
MRASTHTTRAAQQHDENHLVALSALDLRRQASLLDARIVGDSGPMRRLKLLVAKVAATHSTALITGESGTGKELVARAFHDLSPRASGPFLALNCGALPDSLLESELFGHVRGAFTGAAAAKKGLFEAARGGTLFLDEVGETSPAMQVRLLRVLQERRVRPVGSTEAQEVEVDLRMIAATNRDLNREVEQGLFRRDLFYRLNVVPVEVPPLRERSSDIAPLARHLLAKVQANARIEAPAEVEPEALRLLCAYDWPGNVRELENALERLSVTAGAGAAITAADVRAVIGGSPRAAGDGTEYVCVWREGVESFGEHCDRQQLAFYHRVLEAAGGNHAEAARRLRVKRTTLLRHVRRLEERTAAIS